MSIAVKQLHLTLDHLVVAAPTLEAGVTWAEAQLGVRMAGGGAHPHVATHNRLLRLGDCYLEVIARDPTQNATRTRWFGLDDAQWSPDASTTPRLITWVVRTNDLDAALRLPVAQGVAREASRESLRWRIGVPDDGAPSEGGAFPTFIEWPDGFGPARNMPDSGCSLETLTIRHPHADAIAAALANGLDDPRIRFEQADACALTARIATPSGPPRAVLCAIPRPSASAPQPAPRAC